MFSMHTMPHATAVTIACLAELHMQAPMHASLHHRPQQPTVLAPAASVHADTSLAAAPDFPQDGVHGTTANAAQHAPRAQATAAATAAAAAATARAGPMSATSSSAFVSGVFQAHKDRRGLYDAQGRLLLKNLTLPELTAWAADMGEHATYNSILMPLSSIWPVVLSGMGRTCLHCHRLGAADVAWHACIKGQRHAQIQPSSSGLHCTAWCLCV